MLRSSLKGGEGGGWQFERGRCFCKAGISLDLFVEFFHPHPLQFMV